MGNAKIVLRIKTAMSDVVDEYREIDDSTVALPDGWHSWHLDSDQMATDTYTKRIIQTVDQKNNRPIQVFKELPTVSPKDINKIADESWEAVKARLDSFRQKNSLMTWFAILALLILIIISIVIATHI